MKKILLSILFFTYASLAISQSSADVAVQLSASVQTSPAQITLGWPGNASTSQYQVFRKLKIASSWGGVMATLPSSVTQYIDNSVTIGTSYEYRVIRVGSGYTGFGYINSGIQVPETDYRGKLLLLIDSSFIPALNPEIDRLVKDIEGDGWTVKKLYAQRTDSVTWVKNKIVAEYNKDTLTKAVFILGHVPVPYSGNINPDGHPDHLGAWPADCYYGDVDGIWTDYIVTSTTASPPRTQNTPGDGKFDQNTSPTPIELQVGRVDMANMNTFTLSEQQLLKNYLDKDHNYRKKIYAPLKRAVIDDNFGYFGGEAFGASGYKNFGPVVGASSVTVADYFTAMAAGSYQWSYGCGGGTYISASGIGNTGNFAASNLDGVFTMLFGSYFGDWDAPNSFLKAPLAQGKMLTNVWSGRPHYQLHHMGLGENIGYGVLITQNNPGNLYYASPTGITGRWVHNALMGDPTLRQDIVAPVSNVVATKVGNDCHISWSASTETTIVGYNIYVKNDSLHHYTKLNASPVSGTTYTDYCLQVKGIYSYLVRALRLETVPSGSYYNMSEGVSDTAYNASNFMSIAGFSHTLSATSLSVQSNASVPCTLLWDFGNGQTSALPSATNNYSANGVYLVTLYASSACRNDTAYLVINISEVGIDEFTNEYKLNIYPNPASGKILLDITDTQPCIVTIYTASGKVVYFNENHYANTYIDLSNFAKGIYFIKAKVGVRTYNGKLMAE